ncbi:Hypothetical Protein RradSPS_0765 [Rubrobacter radiotolerans]|uniref:Uncharacterized protein n=1 Tax=Rubrobacter radiotolerans TaxID=42256 RepID=A0A023X176_RUBRA|nr:hypothetical protein [Rubrobacter radiotolerans]AHY46048.1 Hypothetical Protein RradSPS_0765 [Rubrobacter radiotolerans]MDX5893458.1 hypothetical protein [Rubrobacter radiotolerans]SMC03774.1 conserved hypothetical protein [Rubrobacter radiotolerans DSM 5868]
MSNASMDRLRQGVTVFGAVFQVLIGFFVPVGSLVNREVSLIIPAGWAFSIWGPIFLLCGVYAVYQLLPSKRYDPLLRRVGWPLGLTFVGNGVWTAIQPLQSPVLSQVVITIVLVLAIVALVRFARSSVENGTQQWIVGLPVGLLAGWLTAANVVGFNDMLVRLGVVGSGLLAALVGAGLLVVGVAFAAVVIRVVSSGPPQATVTYAVGVVWGLFGIVANQYDASLITAGVAALGLVLLLALLFGEVRKSGARNSATTRVA